MLAVFVLLFLLFFILTAFCMVFINKMWIRMLKDEKDFERKDDIQEEYHKLMKEEIRKL